MIELGVIVGLTASLIVAIAIGLPMYAIPTGRLMNLIKKQESIIGYKIDEVFIKEDFTVGDYQAGRGSRNNVFIITSAGDVILLRECVDKATLKNVIFDSDEKKVTITLVNGARVNLRMSLKCAEEIHRWIDT